MNIVFKMKKEKKAEMTITQTLTTILLILGFVILLFIFYRIYSTVNIDRETCRESVVFRATAAYLAPSVLTGSARTAVPLKCKTSKICLTAGFGGTCDEFIGEKGVTTVKIKDITQLQKIYAEEIINCWTMLGEGKLDLFSEYLSGSLGVAKVYPSCIICTRIALDKFSLEKAGINLSAVNIERYMATHLLPDKNATYLSYIGGNRGKISISELIIPNATETGDSLTLLSKDELIPLSKDEGLLGKSDAILFMQISAPTQGGSIRELGSLIFGGTVGSFTIAPVATTRGITSLGKACTTWPWGTLGCGVVALGVVAYQQGSVAYNRAISAGYCGDVSTGGEERNGCSVVRTVSYNETSIADYCSNIESIP